MTAHEIARAAYEIVRAFAQSVGDDAQPEWNHAPEWLKAYNTARVEYLLAGDFWPEAPHQSWLPHAHDVNPQHEKSKDGIFVATVRQLSAPRREIG